MNKIPYHKRQKLNNYYKKSPYYNTYKNNNSSNLSYYTNNNKIFQITILKKILFIIIKCIVKVMRILIMKI